MIHLYTEQTARNRVLGLESQITAVCRECGLPPACLKAILMMELTQMDILDPLADAVVAVNLAGEPLLDPKPESRNPLRKSDSSTGLCQIFSHVAIQAINFARERGIPSSALTGLKSGLSAEDPEDLKLIWKKLNQDTRFNLSCAALNLLLCAYQMTGKIDFDACSPADLKLILTRYNADVKHVTAYGEKAYRYFETFNE